MQLEYPIAISSESLNSAQYTRYPFSYNMQANPETTMQAAVDYCRRHPLEQVSRIAAKYGVNQVTLRRRVKGTQVSRRVAYHDQQLFSSGEEGAVVELCELMADCGFPLSKDLLHRIAQDVLNEHNNNTLPPHTTHLMQSLDVDCFGLMQKAY